MTTHRVAVKVATAWTAPDAPREIDGPAVADVPDPLGWARSLTAQDRLDLHGRTLTQLLQDEPVSILDERDGWALVAAPWQPKPGQPQGYQGWVRRAHLRDAGAEDLAEPHNDGTWADPISLVALASRFEGLRYLWGGTSPAGFDCSGFVHFLYRTAGWVIPRDSPDQHAAATPVELGSERVGDLYFFAETDRVTHVGFVLPRGMMLHAPEIGGEGAIISEDLTPERQATLVGAGRFSRTA